MIIFNWVRRSSLLTLVFLCLGCTGGDLVVTNVSSETPSATPLSGPDKKIPTALDLPVSKVLGEEPKLRLEGADLKAVQKTLDAFAFDAEIAPKKKSLEKYALELREIENSYILSLLIKRDPGKSYVGGETDDGVDVTYFINKRNGTVTKRIHQ